MIEDESPMPEEEQADDDVVDDAAEAAGEESDHALQYAHSDVFDDGGGAIAAADLYGR